MSIERDLHELLYCHDCVIVPHWGGFLTHYRSARLDESNQLIHPPGKDVSFNRNLERNDGLLADHVAKREGKPFREAQALIDNAVKEWQRTLAEKGRLELAYIGIFYRDDESNLQFDPDRRSNFLKDAFGLRSVAAVPIATSSPIIRTLPPNTPIGDVLVSDEKRRTFMWAAAATAAVIFSAAAIFAYRMGGAEGAQWSSLDPFASAVERTHVPAVSYPTAINAFKGFSLPEEPLGIRELPLTADGAVAMKVDLGSPAPVNVPVTIKVKPSVKAKAAIASNGRFHIIGGCFAQEENADRFLNELKGKGFQANRLSKYGDLHPVAFGSYARRSDALEALAAMKADGISAAWLLVR
ncbi:MAG: SPOR domain-containing protein [Bacteroidota bacterium]|nr:SPOR domain-containing protein [Bacteroidota bacterium]